MVRVQLLMLFCRFTRETLIRCWMGCQVCCALVLVMVMMLLLMERSNLHAANLFLAWLKVLGGAFYFSSTTFFRE